jgi:hypothetical protein
MVYPTMCRILAYIILPSYKQYLLSSFRQSQTCIIHTSPDLKVYWREPVFSLGVPCTSLGTCHHTVHGIFCAHIHQRPNAPGVTCWQESMHVSACCMFVDLKIQIRLKRSNEICTSVLQTTCCCYSDPYHLNCAFCFHFLLSLRCL